MRIATIRWGQGKTHLYDWEAILTACGIEAPPDWREIKGGVLYEAVRDHEKVVTCSNCLNAATGEVLEHCDTEH